MSSITTTIEVNRPVEEVFAYVTDPARFVEWQDGVLSGHMDGDAPPVVGGRCLTTRKIGGIERSVTSEITHIDPPNTWGVRAIDGPIRAIVDVTVSPLQEGRQSRVQIDLNFTGHGIGKLLVPLFVRRSARTEMPENLDRLKRSLESKENHARTDSPR
ncbi:MAG: SRPBCC family protein [Solirubrobacteraceae bacterium]